MTEGAWTTCAQASAAPSITPAADVTAQTEKEPDSAAAKKPVAPKGKAGGVTVAKLVSREKTAAGISTLHKLLAGLSQVPELQLAPQEADALAEALLEVAGTMQVNISPRAAAWIGLGTTAAFIYGPRIPAIAARKRARKQQQAQ